MRGNRRLKVHLRRVKKHYTKNNMTKTEKRRNNRGRPPITEAGKP